MEEDCRLNDNILRSKGAEKYGILLSKLFEKTWKKKNSEGRQSLLEFTLSWPSFIHFLNIFYQQEEKSKLLSQDSVGLLIKAVGQVWTAYEELQTGEITVQNFRLLQENQESFLKIIKIMVERGQKDCVCSENLTVTLIKVRERELVHFESILNDVGIFIEMCQYFEVDTLAYDQALSTFRDLKGHKICSLCKSETLNRIQDVDSYEPQICAFTIEDGVLEIIPQMLKCSKGTLFMKLWTRRGRKCVQDKEGVPLTKEEVFSLVWEPVYETLINITKQIRDGTMLFTEFQKYFGKMHDDNLVKELQHLSPDGDRDWIEKRMEQIREHRTVQQCVEGASVIMNVVETYKLKGNFDQINLIVELASGKDIAMNKLDKDLIKATVSLKGMTKEQADCLGAFMDCKPLVEWIRGSMKSLQELKVFVDLASISAGEGDMEVAKVKCLHAATTGYAPLIFNLDEKCGSKMFLEKCELVWKELASDPKLPEKLMALSKMNIPPRAQHFLECEMEECEGNCEFYCNNCHLKLCKQCKGEHLKSPKKKNHEVVLYQQRNRQLPVEKCEIHPTKDMDILCEECQVPVCSKCVTQKEHRGHLFTDLETIYAQKCVAYQEEISKINEYFLPTSESLQREIKKDSSEIKGITDNIRTAMKTEGETLKSLVDTVISENMKQVDQIEHSLLEDLNTQDRTMDDYISYLNSLVKELQGCLSSTEPQKLISEKNLKIRSIPETAKPTTPGFTAGQYSKSDVTKLLGRIHVPDAKTEKREIRSIESVYNATMKLLYEL